MTLYFAAIIDACAALELLMEAFLRGFERKWFRAAYNILGAIGLCILTVKVWGLA